MDIINILNLWINDQTITADRYIFTTYYVVYINYRVEYIKNTAVRGNQSCTST